MNYKEKLEGFFKEKKENVTYVLPIFEKLTQAIKQGEESKDKERIRKRIKEEITENNYKEIGEELFKFIEQRVNKAIEKGTYTADIFPTIISQENAPNFYVGREKPDEEEVYKLLYLMFTGIYKGDRIVNVDNVEESLRANFREYLINEKILIAPGSSEEKVGADIGKMLSKLGIKKSPLIDNFIYSFIILSIFVAWIKEKNLKKEKNEEEIENIIGREELEKILEEKIKLTDEVTLVVFHIPKQKKKTYYLPKIRNFILNWYYDYLVGLENNPSIIKFVFSNYIADEDYSKLSSNLLDKFLYYFLNGHVNGELLNKLVTLKIFYELRTKKGKKSGFSKARDFFRKLSTANQ